MKEKVKQLESDAQTINWYLSVMERGKNTHEIAKEYNTDIKILERKL